MRRQYLHYRNSGVEWLGEVPKHWEVRRIKRVVSMNPSKLEVRGTLTKQTPVVFLPMEKVEADGQIDESEIRSACEVWDGFTYFRKEDILVAKITPCFENGKGAFLGSLQTDVGFGSTEFHVLRAGRSILPKFLYHLTTTHDFRTQGTDAMTGAAGQKRVPSLFVGDFPISIPPLDEQHAIAKYLDRGTERIDKLVAKHRLLIERLAEYRTALITRTVTQGLPPEAARATGIDPSPQLKSSGVEWLGDVPAHWEIRLLGHLASKFGSGVTPRGGATIYQETGIPFLRSQNIQFDGLQMENVVRISEELHDDMSSSHVRPGDVLLNITGASIGRVCFVPAHFNEGNVNQHVCIIRPHWDQIQSGFLSYYLSGSMIQSRIYVEQSGASREGLTLQSIRDFPVPLPPLDEQHAIVAFLDRETGRIDSLSRRVETAIERLQEYRASLITAAVTGKIDVREPVYEEAM